MNVFFLISFSANYWYIEKLLVFVLIFLFSYFVESDYQIQEFSSRVFKSFNIKSLANRDNLDSFFHVCIILFLSLSLVPS